MKHKAVNSNDDIDNEYTYMDIYNKIKRGIEEGMYLPGTKILAESELSLKYNVKRFTVRKAIQKLITDGLIFAIRNRGYYVKFYDIDIWIKKECSYTLSMLKRKMNPKVKILEIKTVSPDSEHKKLFDLKNNEMLWEIYVLRYYRNVPFLIGRSYIPYKRVPSFNMHYLKVKSIHRVLREVYGIKPERKSSVCRTSISGKRESRLLSIFENSPLLKVTNINVDQEDIPIEYSISTFRSDIVRINVNL